MTTETAMISATMTSVATNQNPIRMENAVHAAALMITAANNVLNLAKAVTKRPTKLPRSTIRHLKTTLRTAIQVRKTKAAASVVIAVAAKDLAVVQESVVVVKKWQRN